VRGGTDAEATRGMGGVVGTVWGAAKGMGAVRGMAEVDEVHDEEATKGQVVRPPGVAVEPATTSPWAV
jgi:hypothetical protein